MKRLLAVLLFAAATSLAAQPVTITSVSPSSGPAEGGTVVTIKGTGFQYCVICSPPLPGPAVSFGGVYANVTVLNETTLQVIAPPHLPATVNVRLEQNGRTATLDDAFTFTGNIDDGFERILLPLFTDAINGQFGSLWVTQLRLANRASEPVSVFGLLPHCALSACIPLDPFDSPYEIGGGASVAPSSFEYRGKPGAFIYVPKSHQLSANLRAFDQSRSTLNFGTEIPVVRARELSTDPIQLLGVPMDPRFRNTLRIYATAPTAVLVGYDDIAHHVVLQAGENIFEPAYAQFTDFPVGQGTVDFIIIPSTVTPPMPGLEPPKVWAFISVTNNETQLITTISPQR